MEKRFNGMISQFPGKGGHKRIFLLFFLFIILTIKAFSQPADITNYFPDFKITGSYNPSPGYFFLAAPLAKDTADSPYLAIVDNEGTPVFFRKMDFPALIMTLQSDGRITYISGKPETLYFMDEMLHVVDSISPQGYKLDPHNYAITEQGNIILLGQAPRIVDMSEHIVGGRVDATVKDFVIQEFDKNKNLLYTWKSEDHFNILDGNEESIVVDFQASVIDYAHVNSVTVDSDTSLLISCRHMDEITKIDRRSGDIIWRLGGKNNDFVFIGDTIGFSHQHSINKLTNGNILFFDNGNLHQPPFSSSVEYELDEDAKTAILVKRIRREPDLFSAYIGSTQRLQNNNTIIDWGNISPSITEFHPDGSLALELDFNDHSFSRTVFKFPWQTNVIATSADTINFGLWDGFTAEQYLLSLHNNSDSLIHISSYSTHSNSFYIEDSLPKEITAHSDTYLTVSFFPQNDSTGYLSDILTINSDTETQRIARQVYLYGRKEDNHPPDVSITPDYSNVYEDAVINIDFSEPVRKLDNTELDYLNVDSLFVFKKDNINGEDVSYNANVNTEKTHVEITPIESLEKGQIYYISVKMVLEDYSDNALIPTSIFFTTEADLNIVNFEGDSQQKVFPNPSSGVFLINFKDQTRKSVQVFAISGTLVYKKEIVDNLYLKLNLSDQKPGVYLLIVINKDQNVNTAQKIIIQ
ncbi:MAG: aryl-sulfate sulfotransferase [Bacteroidales bacterium]|nr:aryl-sulfate sulfotransferase [Bacteroidales bacterium]